MSKTKGQDWKAMLAKLCTDVQAQSKVPVPKPLREAFAKEGYTIPVIVPNPFDRSGSMSSEDMEAALDALAKATEEDV